MHTPSRSAVARARGWRTLAAAGVALIALATLLYGARAVEARTCLMLAVAGFVILVVVGIANASSVAAFLRRRDARRGTDAALATLFMAAILVVVQATSVNRSHTFDLTRNHRHTLAPQTVALLDSLDRDISITGFFRVASPKRDGAEQLLSLYRKRSSHVGFTLADPDRQPELARRMDASLDVFIVESAGDRRVVRTIDEEALTNAIVSLTRVGPRAVYFVTGHGEKDLSVADREGYSAARARLEAQGYSVRTVSLVGGADVPADCSVLVVAGPRTDYFADETSSVQRYLERGGSLLAMIDPMIDLPRLADVLARYRLAVLDAAVFDAVAADAGDRSFDETVAKIRRYEAHAITRGFNYLTLYPRARPVVIRDDSTSAGVSAQYLCFTDDDSWGETDPTVFRSGRAVRDGGDFAGPIPIAAAAVRTPLVASSGRVTPGLRSHVVLVGDSDFACNAMLGVLGNTDFLLNCVAFLSDDIDLIQIRPRRALGESVYITERQGRMIFIVCLVLLPLAPIVAGVVVVTRRRRL